MTRIRSFTLVVVNLVWDLWIGSQRSAEFYDSHTAARTKTGYFLFITLASIHSVRYCKLGVSTAKMNLHRTKKITCSQPSRPRTGYLLFPIILLRVMPQANHVPQRLS